MTTSAVVHVQFHAADPEKLAAFYSELFGWTAHPVTISHPESGRSAPYCWLQFPEQADVSAGITSLGESRSPAVIVEVGDIGATLARAEELGGKRLEEATHLELSGLPPAEGNRVMAAIADPSGNFLGLLERSSQK
jgi:predicted enzyme related to lactoylglutathione lyase